MNRRPLGRSGLPVSELCLGTLNFGWSVNESLAFAQLDAFRAASGNFIQATSAGIAADVPALSIMEASEAWVGQWWRERGLARADLCLATRFVLPAGGAALPSRERLIRRYCEQSLLRLRTDYLDVVLIEWSETLGPVDEVLQALSLLRRAGLVRYFGAAGFPAWRLMESLHRAAQRNVDRFELAQLNYSLVSEPIASRESLQLAHEYRVGCLARAPLAGGALMRHGGSSAVSPALRAELDRLASRYRISVAQLALAWVLAQPRITAPVFGASTLEHLHQLLAVPRLTIQPADFAALTALAGGGPIQESSASSPHVNPLVSL